MEEDKCKTKPDEAKDSDLAIIENEAAHLVNRLRQVNENLLTLRGHIKYKNVTGAIVDNVDNVAREEGKTRFDELKLKMNMDCSNLIDSMHVVITEIQDMVR